MKKTVLSLFLALSFMLSAFVGVACGANTSNSSENRSENSVIQNESVTDSTESSVESLEESTTSSVESSVESADSRVEVTGTPIEYEVLNLNGWATWEGSPNPQVVTSKEEMDALFATYNVVWDGEPSIINLPTDYFEEKAVVFYFYTTSGDTEKREIQGVFLDGNVLQIDMLTTSKYNTTNLVLVPYLWSIGIDKEYVGQIEQVVLNAMFKHLTD